MWKRRRWLTSGRAYVTNGTFRGRHLLATQQVSTPSRNVYKRRRWITFCQPSKTFSKHQPALKYARFHSYPVRTSFAPHSQLTITMDCPSFTSLMRENKTYLVNKARRCKTRSPEDWPYQITQTLTKEDLARDIIRFYRRMARNDRHAEPKIVKRERKAEKVAIFRRKVVMGEFLIIFRIISWTKTKI